jgi:hypothetical protein
MVKNRQKSKEREREGENYIGIKRHKEIRA